MESWFKSSIWFDSYIQRSQYVQSNGWFIPPSHRATVPTTSLLRSLKKAKAYWEPDERARNGMSVVEAW